MPKDDALRKKLRKKARQVEHRKLEDAVEKDGRERRKKKKKNG